MANLSFFEQIKVAVNGKKVTAYKKRPNLQANKTEILGLVRNKRKFHQYETKTNPRSSHARPIEIKLKLSRKPAKVRMVRVEDIDQFKKVKNVRKLFPLKPERLSENKFKNGLVKLLGLQSTPKDWGGEINDIFAATVSVGSKKVRGAFALKGPAKKGPLTPGMMGKNGDQIQRLFRSPADLLFFNTKEKFSKACTNKWSNSLLQRQHLARTSTMQCWKTTRARDSDWLIQRHLSNLKSKILRPFLERRVLNVSHFTKSGISLHDYGKRS